MTELHALFQHLLAHVCSSSGIVLLLVLAVAGLLVFCRRIFGRGFLAALFLLPVTFVAVQTGALKPPQSGPDARPGVVCWDSPLVLPDPVGPVSSDVSSVSAPVLCLTEQTVLSNRVGLAAAWSPDAPVDILASFRSPTLAPPDWRIEDVFTSFLGPTNHAWSVARDPDLPMEFRKVEGHSLAGDADRDGVANGRELALGTDPFSPHSDGDLLSDGEELGTAEVLPSDDFLWFDVSGGVNFLWQSTGTHDFHTQLWSGPYAAGSRTFTHARMSLDGFLSLLPNGGWPQDQVVAWSPTNDLRTTDFSCGGLAVVAMDADLAGSPYGGGGLYAEQVTADGRDYDVFEWKDVSLGTFAPDAPRATFEAIVPHDETNVVYVSYLSVDPGFPSPMRLGVQDASRRSVLAPSEFYTVGGLVSAPVSGTTYRYRLGANTDPRVTDAEWSVIGQGEAWVRANFARLREIDPTLSAPEDVLAQGYSEWLSSWVGVNCPNGRYAFTLTLTDPPEGLTLVMVGPWRVTADGPASFDFPLEVFETYPVSVEPAQDGIVCSWDDGYALGRPTADVALNPPSAAGPGAVTLTPLLVATPANLSFAEAPGATLSADWNVPDAQYSWTDQGGDATFADPSSPVTTLVSVPGPTTLEVTATAGSRVATGSVAVTSRDAFGDADPPREPATLGWTTGTNAYGSAVSPDVMRPLWAMVNGDGAAGVPVRGDWTVAVPAGRTVYAAVYAASTEHPSWTDRGSQYNDTLYWRLCAADNRTVEGTVRANALHAGLTESEGRAVRGVSPAAFVGGGFFTAPTNTELSVSVTLSAKNVGDGERPSGVAVAFYPIVINQANHPRATGRGGTSDDTSLARTNALVRTGGVAYITGEPAPPELRARINGLPAWLSTRWTGRIESERGGYRPNDIDTRTLVTNVVRGANGYDITAAFTNEVIGGRVSLQAQVSNTVVKTIPFFIRGKNPTDNVASNYISTAVDPAFRDFAWMIAKHESRTWSANGQRVYNQFNPRGSIQEHPMKGENEIKDSTVVTNWGWGICQIDRGPTGTVSRIVYDWRHNVDEMNSVLREKRAIYRTLVGYYRQTYQNDSSVYWVEPDALVTNVNGIAVSAEKWAVMTLYNGSKGLPAPEIGAFGVQKTPLVFDPETSTWRFHTNSKNYVPNVLQSAGLTEVE